MGAQGAAVLSDDNYHTFQLVAFCPMKPEKKDVALKIMSDESKTLETSCDAAKFQKCKEFVLKQINDQTQTNGYWLNVISQHSFYGYDCHTDYVKTVEALTPQDICNFMKEFNKAGNHITVMMLPAK